MLKFNNKDIRPTFAGQGSDFFIVNYEHILTTSILVLDFYD